MLPLILLWPLPTPAAELVRRLALLVGAIRTASEWRYHHPRNDAVRLDRLRATMRCTPDEFATAAIEAESAGWITLELREDRRDRVRLERFAAALFGLLASGRRPAPDPDRLAGLPHAETLASIATFCSSAPFVSDVANATGRDEAELWEELQAAEKAGLVELWPDHPVAPTVGLSSVVASRLGLVMTSDGSAWLADGEPDTTYALELDWCPSLTDWTEPGEASPITWQADPRAIQGHDQAVNYETACGILDQIEIERTPAMMAQRLAERIEARKRNRHIPQSDAESLLASEIADLSLKIPEARLILGLAIPWPVMVEVEGNPRWWQPEHGPCPACRGTRLPALAVCIVCHASGLDSILPAVTQAERDADPPDALPDPRRKWLRTPQRTFTGDRSARKRRKAKAKAG